MFRKLVCAMFIMTIAIGLVAAEEFNATITKAKDGEITYQKYKKAEKGKDREKDGDAVTIAVAKDAKITKGKFSFKDKKFAVEAGDAIEGGLTSDTFKKIDPEKGLFARITTDDDKKTVTAIAVISFDFKKKKKDDKKTEDKKTE